MINIFSPESRLQFVSRETFLVACRNGQIKQDALVISINDDTDDANEVVFEVLQYAPSARVVSCVFPDEEVGIEDGVARGIISAAEDACVANAPIIVHCLMGISRSAAVAKFLNEHLELDDWFINAYHGHNKAVYNSLAAAAGTSLASYYADLEARKR